MKRRSASIAAGWCLLLGSLNGCGGTPDEIGEPTAERQNALADCSTALGNCYVGCQNEPPTPRPECFTTCEQNFHRCIESPVAIEVSSQ